MARFNVFHKDVVPPRIPLGCLLGVWLQRKVVQVSESCFPLTSFLWNVCLYDF